MSRRQTTENNMLPELSSLSRTVNHKLERTRDELRDVEGRLLILEQMSARKEHLVPLTNRILSIEIHLNDILPCLVTHREALRSCVTKEECVTYVKALEEKMRETILVMRAAVHEPWAAIHDKADAAINRIEEQMSGLVRQLEEISGQNNDEVMSHPGKRLQEYPLDTSVPFYMDALLSIGGATASRADTFQLLKSWIAAGNSVHIRRTKKKGRECYGVVEHALPQFSQYVAEMVNQL